MAAGSPPPGVPSGAQPQLEHSWPWGPRAQGPAQQPPDLERQSHPTAPAGRREQLGKRVLRGRGAGPDGRAASGALPNRWAPQSQDLPSPPLPWAWS